MNWLKLLIVLGITQLAAQVPVLDLSQDTLLIIQEGKIKNIKAEILFSTKGNIVFKGNSSSFKDILFTLALDSLGQKKEAIIYNNKGAESSFTIKESVIYFKSGESSYPVATVVKNIDNLAIYSNLNDSLLAFIPNTQVTNAQVFSSFFALWSFYKMQDQLQALLKINTDAQQDGLAVIQPVFGNGIVWFWDGKYLYPNGANLNHPMVWIFEDNKLAPRNFPRTQEEWSWDGSGLKPFWGGNPQGQWTWQNGILRQIWNNNHLNEYFIDGNVIRKRFGNFGDNEWEMNGNVPLPIITAIVLGMLFR
jgi:hypothetical protein